MSKDIVKVLRKIDLDNEYNVNEVVEKFNRTSLKKQKSKMSKKDLHNHISKKQTKP